MPLVYELLCVASSNVCKFSVRGRPRDGRMHGRPPPVEFRQVPHWGAGSALIAKLLWRVKLDYSKKAMYQCSLGRSGRMGLLEGEMLLYGTKASGQKAGSRSTNGCRGSAIRLLKDGKTHTSTRCMVNAPGWASFGLSWIACNGVRSVSLGRLALSSPSF